jgi:polyhydroxybutyrate depolymerase
VRRILVTIVLAGCGGDATNADAPQRPVTFGGDRPVDLEVPAGFDPGHSYPLIVVLHGYGANGFVQEAVFGVKTEVTSGRAFVLAPNGLVDSLGHQFWNADPLCCDFDSTHVDDVAYIGGLIDAVTAAYPISRVYVIGHSNGGFMAYRMACDRADVVESILVLAGAAASDPGSCHPVRPVEVLHVHGDADTEVPYAQSAMPSVSQWEQHDGCAATFHAGAPLDIDAAGAGAETSTQIADGCPAGIDIELWTIAGEGHIPDFNAAFEPALMQWFSDHARP